jgi:hypothetical protein
MYCRMLFGKRRAADVRGAKDPGALFSDWRDRDVLPLIAVASLWTTLPTSDQEVQGVVYCSNIWPGHKLQN